MCSAAEPDPTAQPDPTALPVVFAVRVRCGRLRRRSVPHNVVHFSGDAGAFVLRGETAFLFLLVFEAAGAFFELFATQFAHAAGVAEEPEDGEDGSAEHAEHQGNEDAGGYVVPVVEE